jgi:hypothetical protein
MLDLNYKMSVFHADTYKNSRNPRNSDRVVQEWSDLANAYAALFGHL